MRENDFLYQPNETTATPSNRPTFLNQGLDPTRRFDSFPSVILGSVKLKHHLSFHYIFCLPSCVGVKINLAQFLSQSQCNKYINIPNSSISMLRNTTNNSIFYFSFDIFKHRVFNWDNEYITKPSQYKIELQIQSLSLLWCNTEVLNMDQIAQEYAKFTNKKHEAFIFIIITSRVDNLFNKN